MTDDLDDECKQYLVVVPGSPNDPGRAYELCHGKSFSDRPSPSLAAANSWRIKRDLLPLTGDGASVSIVSQTTQLPSLVIRGLNFGAALWRHAMGGFQYCSQEQVEARIAVCQTCENFDGSRCIMCGCACNGNQEFLNKLAWKSEDCPLKKWPKTESSDGSKNG